jgi:predicted RNase H-like nuclease
MAGERRAGRISLGVDGTRRGWVAVALGDGHVEAVLVVERIAQLVGQFPGVPTGVDIPIGLVDSAPREADLAARALLSGSASSVFAAPCRAVVDAYRSGDVTDFAGANACARRVTGGGLSQQTWNLVPKIAEVDEQIEQGADLREVHPELSFRLQAGQRLASKRTWNGVMQRLALLREVGLVLPESFNGGSAVAADDVFDAAIVAWTAAGMHHAGELRSHPAQPSQHDRGRPIAIWTRSTTGRHARQRMSSSGRGAPRM